MLLCHVAHFLRRLYRVCGNKPSDIAARFLLKSLCLLVLQCTFSWENGPAIIYDAMCFETLFHCASPFPVCISRYDHDMFNSKFPQNCRTAKEIPDMCTSYCGYLEEQDYGVLHPFFLSPPRSNMEPEDFLGEEERKSIYQSLHFEFHVGFSRL